ncbi:RloB domain-containing protein [Staphylococcus pasteuri]|uniref:RloB domain-containing protein n=1 Tax=Staphylococcus pasteuri TaxID=45972 RepID=UPI002DBD7933|nr:hypothetical protein [Staphylococcus pasteuri]MEB7434854.1 hypothetical protein [Staphylococcus pasteuri]
MKKLIKTKIHFYYPEASQKGKQINSDERFYIDLVLKDQFIKQGYTISHYAVDNKSIFKREVKSKNNSEDKFFIVFDTDFKNSNDYIEAANNIRKLFKEYMKIAIKKNKYLKFILSSRSFESYLCMYNRDLYTKPYSDMYLLCRDILIGLENYKKHKSWYEDNAELLQLNNIREMIDKIRESRKRVFEDNHSPINIFDNPDFTNDNHINFLAKTAPYTYFDVLLKELV